MLLTFLQRNSKNPKINGLIVSLIVTILSLILAACIMRKMKQFVTGFIRWNILIANNLIPIQLLRFEKYLRYEKP